VDTASQSLNANLDFDQIQYRGANGFTNFKDANGNDTLPGKLTNDEFSQAEIPSPSGQIRPLDTNQPQNPTLRVIKLTAKSGKKNVFDFSDIQMGQNDVLLLALPKPDNQQPTGIRIFLNGTNLSQAVHITNLAYYQPVTTSPSPLDKATAYLWFL